MNKTIVFPNIDFADSEFVAFELISGEHLMLIVKNWQERKFKIKFYNPIELVYKLSFQISDLYELTDNSLLLEEALSRKYEFPYPEHTYREFQFIDIYNFPFIRIIADSISIEKDEDEQESDPVKRTGI